MMIIDRRTYNFEPGRHQEAVDLVKAEFAALVGRDNETPYRITVSRFGRFSQVAIEWEFENLAAQEMYWAGWQPSTPEFLGTWFGLSQGEIQIEIWDLVEQG
jgi:NIPSNAP